jgi:hypothetical protein
VREYTFQEILQMWPHFVNLLRQSGHNFLSALGTTGLGWWVQGIIWFFATEITTYLVIWGLRGKDAMKARAAENFRLGFYTWLIVMVCVYAPIFGWHIVKAIYDDHQSLVTAVGRFRNAPKPVCPTCESSKTPIQVIIPPAVPSETPFPCDYAMKFTQKETANSLGPSPFGERVEFVPKKFEVKGDTHILPVVLFYCTAKIAGGSAQGIMKDQYTGDPLAAGISITTGSAGIISRDTTVAELWISDQDKFLKAKNIAVTLYGPERFRILCVKQLVVTNQYVTVPNAH